MSLIRTTTDGELVSGGTEREREKNKGKVFISLAIVDVNNDWLVVATLQTDRQTGERAGGQAGERAIEQKSEGKILGEVVLLMHRRGRRPTPPIGNLDKGRWRRPLRRRRRRRARC